jgi:TonB family protein
MRLIPALLFTLFTSASALCQSAQPTAPALPAMPEKPAEILAVALPLYDFASPALKPWHLKASYQLYDDKGEPGEKGTFDYWWAGPSAYRSTWTRAGVEYSVWHLAGNRYHDGKGGALTLFESKIPAILLAPLPVAKDLDAQKVRLELREEGIGATKLPCVMVAPQMSQGKTSWPSIPAGLFPTYCFEPKRPILRKYYSFGAAAVTYNQILRVQGLFLAKEVFVADGARKLLTITVDSLTGLPPNAPELAPSKGLEPDTPDPLPGQEPRADLNAPVIAISSGVSTGLLLKHEQPVYPPAAKNMGEEGKVVLQGTIGVDGHVRELRVVEAPSPLLAEAAMVAVLQWEYTPYALDGKPVEAHTTINVIFRLG